MAAHQVIRILVVAGLSLGAGAGAAQQTASVDRSADEKAIYQTVLSGWLDGSRNRQMVDRRLGPAPSPSENAECIKGLQFSANASGTLTTLDASTFHQSNVELVDGESWRADDPEAGMRQGKSVDESVKAAFAHSLFSFSQIAFSEDGKDALVTFGMHCGMLCGHGATLHMHKANGRWTRAGECGGWIS